MRMVVMQLELTMNMMQLKYIPGTLGPVNFRYILYPSVSDVGIVMVTVTGLVCSGLCSPMRGVVSVMGSMSPTIEEKMVMASMIVTPGIQNTECDK